MKAACLMMLLAASLPLCVAGEKPRAMFGVVAEELPLVRGGLLVRAVRPGSPAEKLNLQPGDRIESMKGQPVNTREDLKNILKSCAPGDALVLSYISAADNQRKTVTVVLGARPQRQSAALPDNPGTAVGGDRQLRPLVLDPTIRKAMRGRRKAVAAQLAALPDGFAPAEVSDILQSIRHLARDANPRGRGWMLGEAGEVTLQFRDSDGVLVLHGANNLLSLAVYDAAGSRVGVYPLNTPQECAAVPPEIIGRLRRLH